MALTEISRTLFHSFLDLPARRFFPRASLEEHLSNEPYVVEGVWKKLEVETVNVVLVNGEKRA